MLWHMRAAIIVVVSTVFSATSFAEGVLVGSLPRSAAQPFATVREAPESPRLRVQNVAAESAAARAGLRDGDVIISIDGHEYASPGAGRRLLEYGRGGKPTTLQVQRGAAARTITYLSPAAPLEQIPGVRSTYHSIAVDGGIRLRTITTHPLHASGRLAGVYFVQWLSCDSIEYPLNPEDHGWQRMLQLLAETSGVVLMRTDKAGIGDSDGDCAQLDYDTELAHHRIAYERLAANPLVDRDRIVIYGASMGGNMAALLAAETRPAGIVIWGTAFKSWFEHLVEFNRRELELSGGDPTESANLLRLQIAYLTEFLIHGKSPAAIRESRPELGEVWGKLRGTSGELYYGRPYRYHQQAQAKNWTAALASLRKPTLVLHGEFDWYEAADDHALIARTVNRVLPGRATYIEIPKTDHHFSMYPDLQTAYERKGGFVSPQRAVLEITRWLRDVVGSSGE
jgi:pimeloyl-ACP methyl ester carboxylesterase